MEYISSFNKGFLASLKSNDTEEFIDIHFYRPLGYVWALFFKKIGTTPNVITIMSIFLGVGAGVCFYFNDIVINIIGVFLLIWANTYDSADGQLARLTGQKSEIGRILDGASGDLWFISIYIAICLRLMPAIIPFCNIKWEFIIWAVALWAGAYHTKQARLADYYRNIHLFFLKGEDGSELDNYNKQKEIYAQLKFKEHPLKTTFQFFYKNYTKKQEKATPNFQLFMVKLREKYPDKIPVEIRRDFRQMSKPLMKWTNILTFNTRSIVLFISILIGMPWIYFVFEIVILSFIYKYMQIAHESICKYLLSKL